MRYFPELDYAERIFKQCLDSGKYIPRDAPIDAAMALRDGTLRVTAHLPANEHMRIESVEIIPMMVDGTFEDTVYAFNLSQWTIYRRNEEFHSRFSGMEFIDLFNKKFQPRKLDIPMYCSELVGFGAKAAFASQSLLDKIVGSQYKIIFHGCHLFKL